MTAWSFVARNVCTANNDELGRQLAEKWEQYGITYQRYVKSLGVGMGAGVRRYGKIMWDA